ncbi:hypothetical protein ACFYPA_36650 [Streptomyces sp. NPDC005775]|uniref:hypothetical protein n=1 Tax=Streptomyces sp. NPDC005775 TaxID=3364729 RepID=UPI00367B65C3
MTDDTNVITFRPRAGDPPTPPPLPPLPGAASPPPLPPSAPALDPAPDAGADVVPGRVRRSAAGSLADVLAGPAPLPPLPAQPTGDVPATFRSEGLDDGPGQQGPGLGALSLSAVLAVALAALRGTVTVVSDWRQRRMERAAEEAAWREAKVKRRAAEEDARAKLAAVPTSAEFGRKAVQDGRKAAAGPSGSGRSGKGSSGAAQGSTGTPTRKPTSAPTKPSSTSPSKAPAPTKGPDKPRPPVDSSKPQPKPKTPDRTRDGKGPGPSSKPGSGKSGGTSSPEKPGKPSSGTLAPSKGKTPGGPGKGALERARDRRPTKPDGGKGGGTSPPEKPGKPSPKTLAPGKGKTPGGQGRKTPKQEPTADRPGGAGGAAKTDQPRPGFRRRKPRPVKPVKKIPGIQHGTAEGHDAHECRCRRCRKAVRNRGASTGPGSSSPGSSKVPPRPTAPPPGAANGPPPGGWAPPPRGARRSADEDLHRATAYTETVITVERADRPGDQARRWEPAPAGAVTTGAPGLPRAPEHPAGSRPGTTSTTEENPMGAPAPRAHVPAARSGGAAAEHLTEVTLDDVLDHLAASKKRCFATYDECAVLADQARKLRRSFEDLAHELAERHNVIGRLTSGAMARLAELMDVVARKAEEMRTRSLGAAESVEVAHDAMYDAYRPVQQATADAGLVMPSARIHNED